MGMGLNFPGIIIFLTTRNIFLRFRFYDECKRRYNIKMWKTFTDCFNCLPVAAIVDEKIFCCHGGLSPDLQSMEQIRRIMRPTDVPDQGLLCDLLWSDPDKDTNGYGENDRGVSFTFGVDVSIIIFIIIIFIVEIRWPEKCVITYLQYNYSSVIIVYAPNFAQLKKSNFVSF